MKEFKNKLSATVSETVTTEKTASTVGSGLLEVFSTPMMIALMENATCEAVKPLLDEGETTVGTKIDITHDKASPIGAVIKAEAVLTCVDGRRLVFDVKAFDESGDVIGKGRIERFAVDGERFMRRISI